MRIDRTQAHAVAVTHWKAVREAAWLSYWIYDTDRSVRSDLLPNFGFRVHRVTESKTAHQFVQYAFVENIVGCATPLFPPSVDNPFGRSDDDSDDEVKMMDDGSTVRLTPSPPPRRKGKDTLGLIYVVFRGSYEIMDWIANANAVPLRVKEYGFSVHSGIYAQLQTSGFDQVFDFVKEQAMISSGRPKLVFCGHSLGGAYAILTLCQVLWRLEELRRQKRERLAELERHSDGVAVEEREIESEYAWLDSVPRMEAYTYGAPLVMENGMSVTALGALVSNCVFNFVQQFDIIPRLQRGLSVKYLALLSASGLEQSLPTSLKALSSMFSLKKKTHEWMISNMHIRALHELCEKSYGPCGHYYLLFDYWTPLNLLAGGGKMFVRSPQSSVLYFENADHFLSLLPKYQSTYLNEILEDHNIAHYLQSVFNLVFPNEELQEMIDASFLARRAAKSKEEGEAVDVKVKTTSSLL